MTDPVRTLWNGWHRPPRGRWRPVAITGTPQSCLDLLTVMHLGEGALAVLPDGERPATEQSKRRRHKRPACTTESAS
jgi:hypothetical protein